MIHFYCFQFSKSGLIKSLLKINNILNHKTLTHTPYTPALVRAIYHSVKDSLGILIHRSVIVLWLMSFGVI